MARNNLVYYGALGFLTYTAYGMALSGALGDGAKKFAFQLKQAWSDTPGKLTGLVPEESPIQKVPGKPPSGSQPVNDVPNRFMATELTDLGGVPVVYNPATGVLKQDPEWVARWAPGYPVNTYPSGVFKTESGALVEYKGKGQFEDIGTGQLVNALAYTYAVA